MRLAWLTDVHLNFVSGERLRGLAEEVAATGAEAAVITGDIGEADDVEELLEAFAAALGRPVHFVLGNHDFYGSSVAEVRAAMEWRTRAGGLLSWLPAAGVVPLTARAALVGHDGWGDARAGDWEHSRVELADFHAIADLAGLSRAARIERLRELGDEAAAYLRARTAEALARFDHVVVATHVPPFEDACWHEGRRSEPAWLPYFTCVAAGEALRAALEPYPGKRVTVLCGHTHGEGSCEPAAGMVVHTGGAEYRYPALQRVLEL